MIGIIYKITNLVNGKIYIGQTTRTLKQRMAEHKSSTDTAIGKAINKYGLKNFKSETVEECETLDELNEREIFWIAYYDCIAPKGYNLTEGGKNGTHSPETREKLSVINKGKKLSPETCKKISVSKKGTHLTAETRAKMSEIRRGKTMSAVTRAKMRDAQIKNRKPVVCVETGEFFESILAAAEHYELKGGSISDTCNGNRNTEGGLHWVWLKDWLIMDDAAKAEILAKLLHRRKKIRCVETGEIFSSTREAARRLNGEHKNIARACKKSTGTAYGYHWEFIED